MSLSSMTPVKRRLVALGALMTIGAAATGCTTEGNNLEEDQDQVVDDPDFRNSIILNATDQVVEARNIHLEFESNSLPDNPSVPRLSGELGTQLQGDGTSSIYVIVEDHDPTVSITSATVAYGNEAAIALMPVIPNDRPEWGPETVSTPIDPCAAHTANSELDVVVIAHQSNGNVARFEPGSIDTLTVGSNGQKTCSPNARSYGLGD